MPNKTTSFSNITPDSLAPSYRQNGNSERAINRADPIYLDWSAAEAAAASATGVHAAVTDTGSDQVITTGITNPPCSRALSATAGGTATDVKAIQVIVTGTNEFDEVITETLPAFTVNTTGIVHGSKAFKTVTSITIPAHDGTGATTSVGFNDKLGLPFTANRIRGIAATVGGVLEGTAPTYTVDADEVEKNTVDPNSALAGTAFTVWLMKD